MRWQCSATAACPPPGADPEFIAIVEQALAVLGEEPSALRARALADLSEDVTFTDPDWALELAREALTIAEGLGDPETLGHVLLSYRRIQGGPRQLARHPGSGQVHLPGTRMSAGNGCD